MEFKSLSKWNISDNTFFPLGIMTIGDSRKAVILCWGLDKVFTFTIKSIEENFQNDSEPSKTYILLTDKSIKQIIGTEYNAICYDVDGDVSFFSSYKSLDKLKYLKNVKFLSPCNNGFVIIRHDENNKVFLEIYPDVHNQLEIDCSKYLKSYDLSWDQLHNSRCDEDYFIKSICYEGNLKDDLFFRVLLNLNEDFEEKVNKEIILFSVDNYIYWLKVDRNDEHFIVPLKCCSSPINRIWYSKERKIIFLLLKSGIVDIIYYSEIFKFIRHSTICLGVEIICSEFIEDEILIYSDGLSFFQTYIEYNEDKQDFELKNLTRIGIEGVLCISYLKYLKKILCLTENRIFYQIDLLDSNKEKEPEFIEIRGVNSVEIKNNYETGLKLNEKLKEELRRELTNFEKFSIYQNKNVIEENCSAEIIYHRMIPNLDHELIYYPKEKIEFQKSSLFVHIKIKIRDDVKKLLQSGDWSILINSEIQSGKKFLRKIKITERNSLQILEVFNLNEIFLLPKIEIKLGSSVKSHEESLLLQIPLTNIKTNGIKNLIQLSVDQPYLGTRESSIEKTVRELNQQYLSGRIDDELKLCSYEVTFNGRFDEIIKLFDGIDFVVLPETFFIVLLNYSVRVCFDSLTKILRFESDDAGALFSIKLFILNGLYRSEIDGTENEISEDVLKILNVRTWAFLILFLNSLDFIFFLFL